MKLKLRTMMLFLSMLALLTTGCGVKDGDKDTHYKPSEFKHNVVITEADRLMRDIELELFDAKTPVDYIVNTCKENIRKLNEQKAKLEETRAKLKDDTDLTSSERKSWESTYNDTLRALDTSIKSVEEDLNRLYK